MKRNTMLFAIVAAAFCAIGAHAQAPADAPADASTPAPAAAPATDKAQAKAAKKAAWEAGVMKDCSAEVAAGGVCADHATFDTGLEKCLHHNRAKLSDGCRATVHPHHRSKKAAAQAPEQAPAAAPAATPQ